MSEFRAGAVSTRARRGGLAGVALAAVLATGVSGCAASGATGPASVAMDDEISGPILLGVTEDPVQQRLAGSYEDAFNSAGRDIEIREVAAEDRVDLLQAGEVNVAIGCVGELLDELDPVKGGELRDLYSEARESDEGADSSQWRDIAHTTMFSALPTGLQASDPGEVMGCDDDSLPQNTVALYRKTALERTDRKALNNVAGGVTDDELAAEGSEG